MDKSIVLVIFFLYYAAAQLNKQMAGPYEIVVHYLESCLKNPTDDSIMVVVKMKKLNRTMIGAEGYAYFGTPLDDNLESTVQLDQFTNGGWKENYFKRDFTRACSTLKTFVPNLVKRVIASSTYRKSSTCPVVKGNYTFKNLALALDIPELPVFFYNKYRYLLIARSNGKEVCCLKAEVDIVPKRMKIKG